MSEKTIGTSSRRSFIRNISFASAFLLSGKISDLTGAEVYSLRKKVKLRFVVASDAHYGQPKTEFDAMIEKITAQVNLFHKTNPLDFTVINGDLIHNEKPLMPLVKQKLDQLTMPYYVTRGNHDMVTEEEWKATWNTPLNHDVVVKKQAIILGDTSNEKGTYLAPDLVWLKQKLEEHKKQKHVFIFLHIPQAKWTVNGIDTPAFFELLKNYPNIKAVFHGHEHDQDGVKMSGNIPFFFDSHIGGNWGTEYKGFRVVELMDDGSMITYMMNPVEKLQEVSY
jgi:3',5'-cyclic AMP phosphodiesterase CpdA